MKFLRVLLLAIFMLQGLTAHAGDRSALTKVTTGSLKVAGHQLQTIVLIMVLTGVDLMKSQFEKANIQKENMDWEELRGHSWEAAGQILNSGETYAAMTGALATGPALASLNGVLGSAEGKGFLRKLLSMGMSTLITFIGWELGAELFTQAREMIEHDEMYERTEKFASLFYAAKKNGPDSFEQATLNVLFGNMYYILFKDPNLRNQWVYNTWRNRMATGEFVTLVGAMASATAIGTSIVPGAGTLWGMAFGLAGGVAAILTPEKYKEPITEFMKNFRRGSIEAQMSRGYTQNQRRADIMKYVGEKLANGEPIPKAMGFPNRKDQIARYLNTYFEMMFDIEHKRVRVLKFLELAIKSDNKEKIEEYRGELGTLKMKEIFYREQVVAYFEADYIFLDRYFRKYNFWMYEDDKLFAENQVLRQIFKARNRASDLNDFFGHFDLWVEMSGDEDMYLDIITHFKLYGYDEDYLFENYINRQ